MSKKSSGSVLSLFCEHLQPMLILPQDTDNVFEMRRAILIATPLNSIRLVVLVTIIRSGVIEAIVVHDNWQFA